MSFPDGYYAAPDPDDPDTITCWKRWTHPTKTSRKHWRPWQRGLRYGPNKHITRDDIPTDPQARAVFLADLGRTSGEWAQQVYATIAADLDAARLLFASFTTCCWQCGRPLRDPESKLQGRGPDCRGDR